MLTKVLNFSPGSGRMVTIQALAYYVDIMSVCVAIINDCFMVVYIYACKVKQSILK